MIFGQTTTRVTFFGGNGFPACVSEDSGCVLTSASDKNISVTDKNRLTASFSNASLEDLYPPARHAGATSDKFTGAGGECWAVQNR